MSSPGQIAFSIFGFDIRFYGLLITAGMIVAIILTYIRCEKRGIPKEGLLDILIWSIPMGIIGARFYYVIFKLDMYDSFLEAINIRHGGLAIHGGLIFGIGTAIFMAKKKTINWFDLLDTAAPGIVIAQGIGRWGNFFNSEAHGTVTDLPWAILVNGQYVHPTFLYESIWCIGLGIALLILDKKPSFKGRIFTLYLALYSLERFFVEGLRTDSLMFGPLRQAQLISIFILIVSVASYFLLKKKYRKESKI